VRINVGDELQRQVVNNTGVAIDNGKAVCICGVDATSGLFEITLVGANDADLDESDIFITTMNFAAAVGTKGRVTRYGEIHDLDTSGRTAAEHYYLSATPGEFTTTKPTAPSAIVHIGHVNTVHASEGIATVDIHSVNRPFTVLPFAFNSNGIGAGTYYTDGGFYKAPAAHKAFNQGALTQTYGTANTAYGAHAFIVCGGAGTVNTGVVGIRVTGSSITDAGVYTASDTETLSADITGLALNQYVETSKKWVGTVTFTLYTVSGSPTTYSLNANYGYAKYEDIGNRDLTVVGVQIVGRCGATDTAADMSIIPHISTGWVYSAAAFVPGSTPLATFRTDNPTKNTLTNAE